MAFRPYMKPLSDEQVKQIHEKAIEMLDRFGIDIADEACKKTMLERGCRLIHGGRIQISHDLIDGMLRSNKQKFEIQSVFSQKLSIELGKNYHHSFGGAAGILDLNGNYRSAGIQDLIDAYALNDGLKNLDMACAAVYPTDTDDRITQYMEFVIPIKYSRKPINGAAMSHPGPAKYVAMLSDLLTDGDPGRPRPFTASVSPQSPFIWTAEDIDCVRHLCGAGIPTTVLASPMAGLTSPLSPIGIVTQNHAEVLAWAVWYYVVNPDCPRVYAARMFYPNMRTCQLSIGLPENAIVSAMAAQLATYCGFISDTNGGYVTSCDSDAQIGFEKMLNFVLPVLAGSTMMTTAGGIANGSIYSPIQHVIDDEIAGRVNKVVEAVSLEDEEIFGMDAIEEVVLNGSTFLQEPETVEYLRKVYEPTVAFNGTWAKWTTTENHKGIRENAEELAREILGKYEKPEMDPALEREIDSLTKAAEKELLGLV